MHKINDSSSDSKDFINLYNLNRSIKKKFELKDKRNSLDLNKLSRNSISSQKKSNISENSYNNNIIKIQKIKDVMPNIDNSSKNTKDSISFKMTNFPMCLSFMTNSRNYINSINKKFRVKNLSSFYDGKTVSDNNNSSLFINNNSSLEKKKKKNIFNFKLNNNKKSRNIKKILSKINLSVNNPDKNRNKSFFESENSYINPSVNIKNYNYIIGTIDKSINFFDQNKLIQKKDNIKKLKKIEKLKEKKFSQLPIPKKNYLDTILNSNVKLNSPKKKLQNIFTKKIKTNLITSADNDINNKETSINDSQMSLKLKYSSSKMLIPKIENNHNNKTGIDVKKEEKKEEEDEKDAFFLMKKKFENDEEKINTNILKKKLKKTISFNLDIDQEKNEKEKNEEKEEKEGKEKNEYDENENEKIENKERSKKKKYSNRKSSILEKTLQKRILYLYKKSQLKNKMKFSNIKIKNQNNNLDEKANNFLNKIITVNNLNEKLKSSKKIKESKNQTILSRKKYIDKIISIQNEKLDNYFTINEDLLTAKKNIMLSTIKIFQYKEKYLLIKKNSILHLFIYSYIAFINKCSLDINTKNFIYSDLDFSSLSLPQLSQDNSIRQSLILSGIKQKTKKKERKAIFSTVKTKFIENKNYYCKNIVQLSCLNFITKELDSYNVLKTVNYLEKENDNINNINNIKQNNTNSNFRTQKFRTSVLKRKRSKNLTMMKKMKYTGRNSTNVNQSSLSILENKKFFSKEKGHFVKRIRNSISGNFLWYQIASKFNFKKILSKSPVNKDISDVSLQKEYHYINKVLSLIKGKRYNMNFSYIYDLLKQIKSKEIIESILRLFIIEGEAYLFIQYLNKVLKKIDINSKDERGNTFLILSVKTGMNYISKILLEKGIDPNIQNYEGNSALHFSLSRKNFEMADLLKIYGAKEDLVNKKGYIPWECLGRSIENVN